MLYRPKEVCERLGVSSATLRRWSDTFSEHLSPSAGKSLTATGGSAQRRYTEEDVATLARAKALLDGGNTYEEAVRRLQDEPQPADLPAVVQTLTEPSLSVSAVVLEVYREALASKDQTIAALESTVSALESTTAAQQTLIEELRNRPVAIQATIAPPPVTLRQWIDTTWVGRMLGGQREERRTDPEGLSQAPAP